MANEVKQGGVISPIFFLSLYIDPLLDHLRMSGFGCHINPIRSGGGGGLLKPSPPIFCSHAFNFGAALLCVGDFSQKIV